MRKRFLNRGEDINVITGNLGMHPYQLPLVVWRMLRFYKLCRTKFGLDVAVMSCLTSRD
jgi:hypothetical protein